MIEWLCRMGRAVWLAFWPWMLHEIVTLVLWLLLAWLIDETGVLLLSSLLLSAILYPVYRYREAVLPAFGNPMMEGPGPERASEANWLLLTITAVSGCILLNMLLFLLGISRLSVSYKEVSISFSSAPFWLRLLVMGFAAPVAEELIFRGLGYGTLRRSMGTGAAAIWSAVCFGLFHGNLVQGSYAGGLGMLLAFAYEYGERGKGKNGGLKAAVWFHICANLTSLAFNAIVPRLPEWGASLWFLQLLLAAGAAGTLWGIWRMNPGKRG